MFHVFHQGGNQKVSTSLLGGGSRSNCLFSSLQLTLDSPKISGSIYEYGIFKIDFQSQVSS